MARILYVWELGDNYGHMLSFSGIAEELAKRGHEVVVALQDLSEAGKFFDRANVKYIQVPIWKKKQALPPRPAITYADLIRASGYTDIPGLTTFLKAWRELFTLVAPDMAVFDASPTGLLAARGMGFKQVVYGSGYAVPPISTPLPNLRVWQKVPPQEIARREKEVVEVINIAAANTNIPPIASLGDVFKTDAHCLLTFQELDHYEGRGEAEYLGPRFSVDAGARAEWPGAEGKRVFAYIRPSSKCFTELLEHLTNYPASIIISAPGINPKLIEKYQAPHIVFSTEPVQIEQMRREADMAICHSGQGTVAAFLLAGVPMVLFPNHLEQLLVARSAVKLGAAVMPKPGAKEVPYAKMMDVVLNQPSYKESAVKFAEKYKGFDLGQQAKHIASSFERMLEGM